MPSGPKKRKKAAAAAAAKKKEEEEMGVSHPPNTSLPPQDEQEVEEKGEMESHSSDVSIEFVQPQGEEPPSPVASEMCSEISLERVEASEAAAGEVRDVFVSERPIKILLEKVEASDHSADEVRNVEREFVEAEDSSVLERPTEILSETACVEASASEVIEWSTEIKLPEVPTEEESVDASEVPVSVQTDSDQSEGEETGEMPHMGTIIENSVPAPASHLEHRATVWNCCGLLDAFTSSQR